MAIPRAILTTFAAATISLFLFYQFFGRGSTEFITSAASSFGGSRDAYTGKRPVHKNLAAVQNDTLGFDKIFVLNLHERSDKRDFMSLAASFSNISLTYRNGVKGAEVPTKALPEGHENRQMGENVIGSWRGHMNIIREIVENKMESALIMEDDMDWDVRIKDQLPSYASGVRSLLNQTDDTETLSPYGDGWDVLWLGRCNDNWVEDKAEGREIFAIENDETIPLIKNMVDEDGKIMLQGLNLPEHTRIVHRVEEPICTFAYAISFKGAQKILYSLSVGGLAWNFDNSLGWWCTDKEQAYGQECIGATPTYFYQHRVKSSISRNSDNFEEQGFAEQSGTRSIRVSVKNNIQRLAMGKNKIEDLLDSFPDEPVQSAEIPSDTTPVDLPPARLRR